MVIAYLCRISRLIDLIVLQVPLPSFRFLNDKLTKHFQKKNMFFRASYVTTVRDWSGNLANYTTTFGAYKKRAKDIKEVPHSFTFVRRECFQFACQVSMSKKKLETAYSHLRLASTFGGFCD